MATRHINTCKSSPALNALFGNSAARTTTNEKSPKPLTANGDSFNHTDSTNFAASKPNWEAFLALAAQFAPTGHSLHCVANSNSFYAERWGHARHLATLDDARKFLVQIGGNHG